MSLSSTQRRDNLKRSEYVKSVEALDRMLSNHENRPVRVTKDSAYYLLCNDVWDYNEQGWFKTLVEYNVDISLINGIYLVERG